MRVIGSVPVSAEVLADGSVRFTVYLSEWDSVVVCPVPIRLAVGEACTSERPHSVVTDLEGNV